MQVLHADLAARLEEETPAVLVDELADRAEIEAWDGFRRQLSAAAGPSSPGAGAEGQAKDKAPGGRPRRRSSNNDSDDGRSDFRIERASAD